MLKTILFVMIGAGFILAGLSAAHDAGFTDAHAQSPRGIERAHSLAFKGLIFCLIGGLMLGFSAH